MSEPYECPTCKRPRHNPPCPQCGVQLPFFWGDASEYLSSCYCGFRYHCPESNANDPACYDEQRHLVRQTVAGGVQLSCVSPGMAKTELGRFIDLLGHCAKCVTGGCKSCPHQAEKIALLGVEADLCGGDI